MPASFLLDEDEQLEAMLAELQRGAPEGWRPCRILFRNFWLFRREEFVWHHGRLFLGGQNRAGKSTVLSMAIPVLLDGNKSDERLQTFGGKGRHMAYYITGARPGEGGPDEVYHFSVRTSYMALEFVRRAEDGTWRYLTFGQGLRHDREAADKSVKSWGFVVTDGRRLGRVHAGTLFDVVKGPNVCLEKAELRRLLGEGGEVFDSNLEYKKAVNRHLFGFRDLAEFDALIEMLLEIRSPGLANNCRPSRIADILADSLPAISEGVTQNTAQALDNIDQTTRSLELLERHIEAARALHRATGQVYRRNAEIAAARFLRASDAAAEADRELAEKQAALQAAQEQKRAAEAAAAECAQREARLRQEEELLQSEEAYQESARRAEIERQLAAKRAAVAQLEGQLARDRQAQQQRLQQREAKEQAWQRARQAAIEQTQRLADAGRAARWHLPEEWAAALAEAWQGLSLTATSPELALRVPRHTAEREVAARVSRIAELRGFVVRRDEALRRHEAAQSAEEEARRRFFAAEERWTRAQGRVREAKDQAAAFVRQWGGGLRALGLDPEPVEQLAQALAQFDHTGDAPARRLLDPLRPLVDAFRDDLRQEVFRLRDAIRQEEAALEDRRAERRALDQAPPEPPRTDEQRRARQALADAGIPFAPAYETLDFAPDVPAEEAGWIESALAQMGLLDALVVEPARRQQALAVLRRAGCGERLLWAEGAVPDASLARALRPDAQHPLAPEAMRALQPGEGRPAVGLGEGLWRHGLLQGTAAAAPAARFVGRTARERHRMAEIARLEAEIAALERAIRHKREEAAATAERLRAAEAEWAALENAEALTEVDAARHALRGAEEEQARERAAFEAKRQATAEARSALEACQRDLQAQYRAFPEASGLDRDGLAEMEQAATRVRAVVVDLFHTAERLETLADDVRRIAEEIARGGQALEEKGAQLDDLRQEAHALEGRLEGIRLLLQSEGAQRTFERLRDIQRELGRAEKEKAAAIRSSGGAEQTIGLLEPEIPKLQARAAETAARAAEARAALRSALQAYPTLETLAERAETDLPAVAASLIQRFGDHADLVAHLEGLQRADTAELGDVFAEQRRVLEPTYRLEYRPSDPQRLVRCFVEGSELLPSALCAYLEERQGVLRQVLERHEVELFERHLLREAGREVRRCMTRARDWVRDINALLARHPMNDGTTVELAWEPKHTEFEAGGMIAKRAHLLWKEESALTDEERDLLRAAFQEEIRQVREQARRAEWRAEEFRQRLAEVLDYRSWFHFRLFVCGGIAGRRRELTDQVFNAGSGSERSMHVLLPLFAGLVSRYEGASPHAPRLVALDEAFAGLDAVNARQLIRVLTDFGLTWVCTSDKPPRLTADLPGASLYVMLRDGLDTATRTFIWNGRELTEVGA